MAATRIVTYHDEEQKIFGCPHYRRNCLIQGACCEEFYGCRLCHDEKQFAHEIDRFKIRAMICLPCLSQDPNTPSQPIAAQCATCETKMAAYFCDVCKFFDDFPGRQIYHCDDCGICRRGTRDEFYHCKTCNCCFAVGHTDHKCLQDVLHSDCPICADFMFNSTEPMTFLKCGHAMHKKCLLSYLENGFHTCPMCKKTIGDTSYRDQQIESYLAVNPMPEEYKFVFAKILCNDCLEKTETNFHFSFNRCARVECRSFNTTVIEQFKRTPEPPAEGPDPTEEKQEQEDTQGDGVEVEGKRDAQNEQNDAQNDAQSERTQNEQNENEVETQGEQTANPSEAPDEVEEKQVE